jgi:hypothetical protein
MKLIYELISYRIRIRTPDWDIWRRLPKNRATFVSSNKDEEGVLKVLRNKITKLQKADAELSRSAEYQILKVREIKLHEEL